LDHSANSPIGSAPLPDYRLGTGAEERSLAWEGARMVLTLAAVLLLLGLGVKLLRRWPSLAAREGSVGGLQVLERVALTQKEAIYLVRAGVEILVVGVGPSGVTLLTRLAAGAEETIGSSHAPAVLRGMSAAASPHGFRLRELAARVRHVRAAWGLDGSPPRSSA
jgi:flagellar biogenesis protein FliO